VSGQQHAPAALYPRERPGTQCTGSWVGPRAGLDGRNDDDDDDNNNDDDDDDDDDNNNNNNNNNNIVAPKLLFLFIWPPFPKVCSPVIHSVRQ